MLKFSNIFHNMFLSAVIVGLTLSAGKTEDTTVGKATADTTEKVTDNTKGIDCPDLNQLDEERKLWSAFKNAKPDSKVKSKVILNGNTWFVDRDKVNHIISVTTPNVTHYNTTAISSFVNTGKTVEKTNTLEITRCFYREENHNAFLNKPKTIEFRLTHQAEKPIQNK